MAYINIDLDEHIDEIDTDVLVNEIKRRAKANKITLSKMLSDRTLSGSVRDDICDILGLNHLSSNEDIVEELLNKIR